MISKNFFQQLIAKSYEIDDNDFDIDDDSTITKIEDRDRLLSRAFEMECEQRNYAIFEDAEVASM